MKYAWMPRIITVDFDYSLISAVKFSVAIFITNKQVIEGINYIKSLLIEDEFVETFWNYFANIWLK
ncbi:hypothetical protein HZS_6565 [Henneguya salminicola]|nr:hypothetical protein HZS_6565 [Henneguya salminicola]